MRRMTLAPALLGSVALLAAGYVVTVALPVADAANTTKTTTTQTYTVGELKGRQGYVDAGCIHCHTQQVRDAATDAGLAERPTRAGDTLADRPSQLGSVRIGPDLACAGDRVPGVVPGASEDERVAAMAAYLRDPQQVRPGSGMPRYDHLSDTELTRLASYLVALRCPGGSS